MVRPIQPLGTYGVITVRRTKNGYVASARFREMTGAYRRVSASAPTAKTAENELKARIAAGLPSTAEGDHNGQTKLTVVADAVSSFAPDLQAATLRNLLEHAARDDVAGSEVLDGRRIAFHEPFTA